MYLTALLSHFNSPVMSYSTSPRAHSWAVTCCVTCFPRTPVTPLSTCISFQLLLLRCAPYMATLRRSPCGRAGAHCQTVVPACEVGRWLAPAGFSSPSCCSSSITRNPVRRCPFLRQPVASTSLFLSLVRRRCSKIDVQLPEINVRRQFLHVVRAYEKYSATIIGT